MLVVGYCWFEFSCGLRGVSRCDSVLRTGVQLCVGVCVGASNMSNMAVEKEISILK